MAPPEPPSPMITADDRHGELKAAGDGTRDRLGLAPLLGIDAGVGAGRVDQGQHRQPEPIGEAHQPDRLPVALGPRHAEIVPDPLVRVGALLGADHHDRAPAEAADPGQDRLIVGEGAVAGQGRKILDQLGDVVLDVRPVRMARDLGLLPGIELAVGLRQELGGAALEAGDLVGQIELGAARQMAQLLDLALELGDRLFEIEKAAHPRSGTGWRPGRLWGLPPGMSTAPPLGRGPRGCATPPLPLHRNPR